MSERIVFISGKFASLSPIEFDDVKLIEKWVNDGAVTYFMFTGQRPMNHDQVKDEIFRNLQSASNALFIINENSKHLPVGFAGLYDVHSTARKAEFRILIGEKSVWSKGIGTEVCEMLTFYGFDRLNLNRIWLGVTAENNGAVRSYEKSGYKLEGRLREDIYRNSRYYDSLRFSILRSEYYPRIYEAHERRFSLVAPGKAVKRK